MNQGTTQSSRSIILNPMISVIESIGSYILDSFRSKAEPIHFVKEMLSQMIRPPIRTNLIFQHFYFIGNQSINIIVLTGFFIGGVFGLQLGLLLKIFGAESMMGAATAKTLTTVLSPLTTSFLLAGRGGAAITAELATMNVNEQVEAMEAMAVDPVHYLVVPRFIAAIVILPLLCGIFTFVGVIGAFVIGVLMFDVDQGLFFEKIGMITTINDVIKGLVKAVVFGGVISTIACYYGLTAAGGAEGVGRATTNSVVMTLLTMLMFDLVITYFQTVF